MTQQRLVKSDMERGQVGMFFVVLVPAIIACFFLVADVGRYLVMRSQARSMADMSALAGAGALNLRSAGESGSFVLQPDWAMTRANSVFAENLRLVTHDWASYKMGGMFVDGKTIQVTVNATCETVFGGLFGVSGYSVSVTAVGRAASGITGER